jgi:cytochrome oxidase assembly protein ShyY1
MAKHWLRIGLPRRNFPGIDIGLLSVALVCAGFAPWRAGQSSPERQLSDPQEARLVRTLRPIAPALANVQVWSDDHPENVRYRLELTKVFRAAGVRTDAVDLTRTVAEREQGLVIVVHDQDRPPQRAIALLRALRKGGLDPSFAPDARLGDRPPAFILGVARPARQGGLSAIEAAAAPASAH